MNLMKRCFAHTQNQWTLLFECDVRGALDQMRGDAIGDARQCTHAARDYNHGVGGIRPAGHVRANVGVRLQLDLARGTASWKTEDAVDETGSSFQIQLFSHDSQSAVGRDEVHVRDALVTADCKQQVP